MADRYDSFATLAANETEGLHYRIRIAQRPSPFVIVAPHGGLIERGTSEVAAAVAADRFSLYCFESLMLRAKGAGLHITSTRFDEPQALRLIAASEVAIGVHGRKDREDDASIWVGGLHAPLQNAIYDAVKQAGFAAKIAGEGHRLSGRDPANICKQRPTGRRRPAGVAQDAQNEIRPRRGPSAGFCSGGVQSAGKRNRQRFRGRATLRADCSTLAFPRIGIIPRLFRNPYRHAGRDRRPCAGR